MCGTSQRFVKRKEIKTKIHKHYVCTHITAKQHAFVVKSGRLDIGRVPHLCPEKENENVCTDAVSCK